MPAGVRLIIDTLHRHGYEAYAVGGCVRDCLLHREPEDWDITTSAWPDEVMAVFSGKRTIPTGLKHGTVTVLALGGAYEVTTYRIDGAYADGRHPESVQFTHELREDLSRRDFTINAMAYNSRDGLVDCFGGGTDLKNRVVRCVGEPEERFGEDYLRMLRAYRFAAVLDFAMEESMRAACIAFREKISCISAERIRAEWDKLLVSGHFHMIERFLNDYAPVLLPEVYALRGVPQNNPYHYLDVYEHTLQVLRHTPPTVPMRLTALFHDTGKAAARTTDPKGIDHFYGHPALSAKIAYDFCIRMKYDNKTISTVVDLVNTHDNRRQPKRSSVRRLINSLGEEKAYMNLQIQQADVMGQSQYSQEENLPVLRACFRFYDEILRDRDACQIKDLAVTGRDVMKAMGLRPGPEIGRILATLLERVLEDPALNQREALIEMMRGMSEY